jgi:hypothetical protein
MAHTTPRARSIIRGPDRMSATALRSTRRALRRREDASGARGLMSRKERGAPESDPMSERRPAKCERDGGAHVKEGRGREEDRGCGRRRGETNFSAYRGGPTRPRSPEPIGATE